MLWYSKACFRVRKHGTHCAGTAHSVPNWPKEWPHVEARSIIADYAVYLLVRVLVCVVQVLAMDGCLAFADALAWLAYRVDRGIASVAPRTSVTLSATVDRGERRPGVRVYRHFCTLLIEIVHSPTDASTNWWARGLLELPAVR